MSDSFQSQTANLKVGGSIPLFNYKINLTITNYNVSFHRVGLCSEVVEWDGTGANCTSNLCHQVREGHDSGPQDAAGGAGRGHGTDAVPARTHGKEPSVSY